MRQLIMRVFYVNVKGLDWQFAERTINDWKNMIERDKLKYPEDIMENYYVQDMIIPSDKYLVEVIYPTKEKEVIPQFMSEVEREKLIREVITYPIDKLDSKTLQKMIKEYENSPHQTHQEPKSRELFFKEIAQKIINKNETKCNYIMWKHKI